MAGDAAERSLLWTDLRWRVAPQLAGAGGAAAAVLESPAGDSEGRRRRGGGRAARKMGTAYREALAPLAAGEEGWEQARAALFALQSETLAGDGRGSLTQLQQGVLTVAQELAERSPEALPPLIRLHDALYQGFRRRRVFSLASFNRLMVESLAELYAARGGSQELAAYALVSLGGYLQEANLPATSSRLFRRALALDPGSRAARLALGSLHERLGDPRGAVAQLEPALAAAPGDAEARLRLAVNLGRGGGDRRRSQGLFEEVVRGDGPAWVRALAHQELARHELALGDAAAAARRLEAAVQELPDDRGLHLLLAVAYDRLRQPRESLDALTRVGSGGGESPRKRYDGWPQGAIDGARSRLESDAGERRTELVRALDGGRG
jgi:tetratricopeptide (TPR) repeat protein